MTPQTPGSHDQVWPLVLAHLRFGADTRGARLLKELLRETTSPGPELIHRLVDALEIPRLERMPRIERAEAAAREALERAGPAGLTPVAWFEDGYPPPLRDIVDPPVVLWQTGAVPATGTPAVSIVGSRKATPAGLATARRLAAGLAEAGFVIVSGLARGIDAAAHEGALAVGGATLAVLGCGADIIYPEVNRRLYEKVRESGALLSEFPPGTPPLPHHFPMRNRIISGLSRAVIVAEASMRSGSLITARVALEQGREVLAVPGSVPSGQFSGCHALIKDGAALVETVEDVLRAMGCAPAAQSSSSDSGNPHEMSRLEATMAVGEPYTVDELAERTGLPVPVLLAELGALEITGRVGRLPGAGFVKFDKSAIGEWHG